MLAALFILLFVAQPVKGPRGESPITAIKGQINADQKDDTGANSSDEPHTPVAMKSITIARDSNQKQVDKAEKQINQNTNTFDLANWLIVGGTWVLAIASIYQARRSDKNSRLQLRAHVHVIPFLNIVLDDGWNPGKFDIINDGQTPAYDVTLWIRAGIGEPTMLFDPLTIPAAYFAVVYMSRGQSPAMSFQIDKIGLSTDQISKIKSREFSLFFYGKLLYKDAFGIKRRTEFRYEVRSEASQLSIPYVCEKGNYAD